MGGGVLVSQGGNLGGGKLCFFECLFKGSLGVWRRLRDDFGGGSGV